MSARPPVQLSASALWKLGIGAALALLVYFAVFLSFFGFMIASHRRPVSTEAPVAAADSKPADDKPAAPDAKEPLDKPAAADPGKPADAIAASPPQDEPAIVLARPVDFWLDTEKYRGKTITMTVTVGPLIGSRLTGSEFNSLHEMVGRVATCYVWASGPRKLPMFLYIPADMKNVPYAHTGQSVTVTFKCIDGSPIERNLATAIRWPD
jgi:hypothetical protein